MQPTSTLAISMLVWRRSHTLCVPASSTPGSLRSQPGSQAFLLMIKSTSHWAAKWKQAFCVGACALTSRALFSLANLLSFLHMGLIRKKASIGDIYFLVNMVAVVPESRVLKYYLRFIISQWSQRLRSETACLPGCNPPSRRMRVSPAVFLLLCHCILSVVLSSLVLLRGREKF